MRRDSYDDQIERLLSHKDETDFRAAIDEEWGSAAGLFQYAHTDGRFGGKGEGGARCGCLTMIRGGDSVAQTQELTEAILADERIPDLPTKITRESLPAFAEWQRRLDKELNRW